MTYKSCLLQEVRAFDDEKIACDFVESKMCNFVLYWTLGQKLEQIHKKAPGQLRMRAREVL